MKEIVMYYSFTGNAKVLAAHFADENGLPLCEIATTKPLGKFAAYTSGCFKALKGAGMPVTASAAGFGDCETAHIFAPVWAGHIAPPMVSGIELLPKGCALHLHLVSASGESRQEDDCLRLVNKGYGVASCEDLRK